MKCVDCCYYWRDDRDTYACCHHPSHSPYPAPCEEEECSGYDELDYEYYDTVESEINEAYVDSRKEFIVFGVGKHSDAVVPMDEIVLAEDYKSAREIFEQRHPEYRSTSAYPV